MIRKLVPRIVFVIFWQLKPPDVSCELATKSIGWWNTSSFFKNPVPVIFSTLQKLWFYREFTHIWNLFGTT